ncbi:MAG: argininosuccinate lyase [Thermodesulfobacteriota bacterium]|nr:argininosuccinate lyase [Thermodesulfobacteriota bacterium]
MTEKPWGGRFSEKTDRGVEIFTSSIDVDKRLYTYDIEGSIAHCSMLAKQSIITEEDASSIIQGLCEIKKEIERGKFQFDDGLEDIHMHIESSLLQNAGKVAQKLHTARSRNDQVALDTRMYLRDETLNIINSLAKLKKVFLVFAENHIDTILPGYTHLQRAQPVILSHHIMAYYEMFLRDSERFRDCLKRINVMPLGSAALAGTIYPIDRAYTAKLLDFPEISRNSIDSVSDRDFIIEFLSTASICMMHFSRLSEELILWSTSEFGFIELPDSFTTGSSIMPQKKNPDVPELIRGKTGIVFGNLMALLSIMKALPLAYNRDMQEDKRPLFDTVDILTACITICTAMIPKLKVNKEAMQIATCKGFLNATDMADYLVTSGMPFRQAHDCVGKAVNFAQNNNKELHELTLKELKTFSSLIKNDVFNILKTEQMINRRKSFGGTAKENVMAAIKEAKKSLNVLEQADK